ncbi:MAG: OmpH family outer membrane protein [Akkermansia sp.]|nr:OmpH family outer membrane protein [Akkermansia sp.]MBQ7022451.1 OmpH family outer membrane protein [Akkermansia sp.]
MKFHTIISTIAVTLCAMVATAQAELKVASVNVTELYTMFYKRFDTEVRLKDEEAKIKAEIKTREDKLRALQEEDQKIQKKYDPSLSDSQVKKLRDQHNIKVNEIQAAQQELQTYVQRRSMAFKELFRRDMALLFSEVQQAITDCAAQGGYDLVIDSSATNSTTGMKIFPHVKSSFDITPEVLKHINAGAPAGFDPKAELQRLYGSTAIPGAAN